MKVNNEQLNKIEERLAIYKGEDQMISSLELAELIAKEPTPITINTGFPTLDKILNGVEGGELIVVTGPTNHGKTTMLISITQNMTAQGINSSWFTLENSPRNFIKAISRGSKLPLFYLPSKNTENHVAWLIERIIEGCVKYNTRVVFIDHLHQIFSIEKLKGSTSLEIADIVSQIKQIAIEYGLIIFLVAHSADNKMALNPEPSIRDIRDSGMISRLADIVLGVWRIKKPLFISLESLKDQRVVRDSEDNTETLNKLKIWKSRREGVWGTLYLTHKDHSFTELDVSHIPKSEGESRLNKEFGNEPTTKRANKKRTDEELGF